MKVTLIAIDFLLLFLPVRLLAQQPETSYVLRYSETKQGGKDDLEKLCLQAAINTLDQSTRVNVLPEQDMSSLATHVLEGGSSHTVTQDDWELKKFVDSTETITIEYNYEIKGQVELLAISIETGYLTGRTKIGAVGKVEKVFKIDYKKAGWAKGISTPDKQQKKELISNCVKVFASQVSALKQTAQKHLVSNMSGASTIAHHQLFPYRTTVEGIVDSKGAMAKTLKIKAGKNFDLTKGHELSVFTLSELRLGEKIYEKFDNLGLVTVDNISETEGVFKIRSGSEEITKALTDKKTVYASPLPYNGSTKRQGLNIAVASFVTPDGFSAEDREYMYRKLRFELMGKIGFNLVERKNFSVLANEKELQKQDGFIEKAELDQHKAAGADLLLEVVFSNLINTVTHVQGSDEVADAKIQFDYLLRLVSVKTGEVIGEDKTPFSKSYSLSLIAQLSDNPVLVRYNQGQVKNKDFFFKDAIKTLDIDISAFLNKTIPPTVIVQEVIEEKKDRAKELIVIGDFDFEHAEKWNIVHESKVIVEGKELSRFENIGLVTFIESKGPGVARVKVKDGGEKILSSMKAGEVLYLIEKTHWIDRWNENYLHKHGY